MAAGAGQTGTDVGAGLGPRGGDLDPRPAAAAGLSPSRVTASIDELALKTRVDEVLNHWPVAGLAVGVIRGGSLAWFHRHGVADIGSGTRIDKRTVFRLGSMTKIITAVAVMQLWEQGLVDLDPPASDYLRAYRLIPAAAALAARATAFAICRYRQVRAR